MAVRPSDQPQYLLTIIMDEPQGTPGNPRLLDRCLECRRRGGRESSDDCAILGVEPRFGFAAVERLILAKETRGGDLPAGR